MGRRQRLLPEHLLDARAHPRAGSRRRPSRRPPPREFASRSSLKPGSRAPRAPSGARRSSLPEGSGSGSASARSPPGSRGATSRRAHGEACPSAPRPKDGCGPLARRARRSAPFETVTVLLRDCLSRRPATPANPTSSPRTPLAPRRRQPTCTAPSPGKFCRPAHRSPSPPAWRVVSEQAAFSRHDLCQRGAGEP